MQPTPPQGVTQEIKQQAQSDGAQSFWEKATSETDSVSIIKARRKGGHRLRAAGAGFVKYVARGRIAQLESARSTERPVDFLIIKEVIVLHQTHFDNIPLRHEH